MEWRGWKNHHLEFSSPAESWSWGNSASGRRRIQGYFLWLGLGVPRVKGGGQLRRRETENIIPIIILIRTYQPVGVCDYNYLFVMKYTEPSCLIVTWEIQKTMLAPSYTQSLISLSGLQTCQIYVWTFKIQRGRAYLHHHCLRPHTGADRRRLISICHGVALSPDCASCANIIGG